MQKLQNGGDFHLVFYGDSITAGWEASGCNESAIDMVTLEDYHVTLWARPLSARLGRACPATAYSTAIHKVILSKRIELPEAPPYNGAWKMQKNWYVPATRIL